MKLKPLGDRVLVKVEEAKEVKKSGIIIPDTAKEKPQEGTVIAVGKGKVDNNGKLIPMDVKEGDKILFGKYSGSEVKIGDEEDEVQVEELELNKPFELEEVEDRSVRPLQESEVISPSASWSEWLRSLKPKSLRSLDKHSVQRAIETEFI